ASFFAPRYFAIETATLMPRALKLCVGFTDSSLTQRSTSDSPPNLFDCRSGVPPSPSETGSAFFGSGKNSRHRHNDFSRAAKLDGFKPLSFRTASRSTIAKSGLPQAVQRFCSRFQSCCFPHALHSRCDKNIKIRNPGIELPTENEKRKCFSWLPGFQINSAGNECAGFIPN